MTEFNKTRNKKKNLKLKKFLLRVFAGTDYETNIILNDLHK